MGPFENPIIKDIPSTSDLEWDSEDPDYEMKTHESEASFGGDVSLDEEEERGVGDNRAPDEFEHVNILDKPGDFIASTIDNAKLARICLKHGILRKDTELPIETDRPYNPPEGYMAISRLMCLVGGYTSVPAIRS